MATLGATSRKETIRFAHLCFSKINKILFEIKYFTLSVPLPLPDDLIIDLIFRHHQPHGAVSRERLPDACFFVKKKNFIKLHAKISP